MKTQFLILFIWITGLVSAQNSGGLFDKANGFYKIGKYEQAIKSYEKIIKNGEVSSELYYNLGNCYYKLNKVAPTIYNYEKSLQLDPNNADAINNLVFAKRLTLDRIEPLPKSFFQKINESILQKLHFETWGILAILSSFLVALFFILYYFAQSSFKKRFYFIGSLSWIFLLLVFFAIAIQQYNYDKNTKFAIIFSQKTDVQSEPIENSSKNFTLHEGTKVKVLDSVDNWKKIKLSNGKIGWVLSENLKEL